MEATLSIIFDTPSTRLDSPHQYDVVYTDSNGISTLVTDSAVWGVGETSPPGLYAEFDIDIPGLLIPKKTGTVTIFAVYAGLTDIVTLEIIDPLIMPPHVNYYSPTIEDYLCYFTSQYQSSSKLLAWAESYLSIATDIRDLAMSMSFYFSLLPIAENTNSYIDNNYLSVKQGDYTFVGFDACIGDQLDVLGQIVGVKREVDFEPTDGSSPILDDDMYRFLIRAKIIKNHWKGSIDQFQLLWSNLLPSGIIVISDNQDMSLDAIMSWDDFDAIMMDLIDNDYIIPRSQGVKINYKHLVNFSVVATTGYIAYEKVIIYG